MAGRILGWSTNVTTELVGAVSTVQRDGRSEPDSRTLMTSNPPQPTPEWAASGPASSAPIDARPAAADGFPAAAGGFQAAADRFQAAADRFQAGPQHRTHIGARDGLRTGFQGRVPGRPGRLGRSPTPPAPRPGPDSAQSADRPAPGAGPQPPVAAPQPGESPSQPGPAEPGDERLATLSYLGVPFLGPLVPLAVYLFKRRASAYVRSHSAQALNLSITALLYTVCALILGTMLALDNIVVALVVVVPLAVALWLITLGYVIVAGSAANRGDYYPVPAWLCATIVR
jgi:uncharacterized protein